MSHSTAIPMVDLRAHFQPLREEILAGLGKILDQAGFILGEHGRALEQDVAQLCGVAHGVGCASGTDALLLALRALGIGPGDEVIVPTFTFIATAEAVLYVGAKPVFVDVDPQNYVLTASLVEAAITDRTKAIIPVHLYGLPADMPAIMSLAQQHHLKVIEDCAQAIGASIHGRAVGSFGDIGCFSFFPSKNLGGAGDGGMVVTNDPELEKQLRGLRNHGSWQTYHHDVLGYNSRLDEMQALILRTEFPHLSTFNAGRQRAAAWYAEHLAGLDLQLPHAPEAYQHVYHQYTIQLEGRDAVKAALQAEQIASAIYYPIPGHRQKMFGDQPQGYCPVADNLAERVLSLPMFPELQEAQVARVAEVIRRTLKD
ncbi:DegT/DnrJ/EryC1/StrS family aminotransferase [Acidithiobacillus thiooxidans]|uniref:DegT/DnrJ/EryC1/StrS family aminotransferase n=1 Tax=Acidithiobacillus thiooxidans TaxID=930 RepID=UPI0002625286|nr:DegT/DnrJ/EryC1/StrS family aminotransferase [Acidithiobacillus thiooxidans]MBU2809909.1 DegT/DnrJ/EryC1/StrS family aminotransferase [Acidithiobacillus thiooxidans]